MGCSVTGLGMAIASSSRLLTQGQVKSLSLTMAIIFALMLLMFMSVKVGGISILPNLFPIVVNFGMMGWLGIELSMVTSLIASIAIGLAVDDTIHYMVRYNRRFKDLLDKRRSLEDTLRHVGSPMIYTTADHLRRIFYSGFFQFSANSHAGNHAGRHHGCRTGRGHAAAARPDASCRTGHPVGSGHGLKWERSLRKGYRCSEDCAGGRCGR